LDERHAASTSCPSFRTSLYIADGFASAILDALHHIAFGDVVT
jgi:hypothetical protein